MHEQAVTHHQYKPQISAQGAAIERFSDLTAGHIMQCGVVSVAPDASVFTAIGLLVDKHISGLPVAENGHLVGMLSEKDVLQLLTHPQETPGQVEQYMTRDLVSFDIQASVLDIGRVLSNNSFRRVAVLHANKLAGIISRADLIRHVPVTTLPAASPAGIEQRKITATDVMQCGLLTVKRTTSLETARRMLAQWPVTGLPVVDDAMMLVGMITEKDILRHLFDNTGNAHTVEDLMTENVVSFQQSDSLFDICDCLVQHDFRRVPILDEGRLVGIVSRTDIILYMLKNKSAVLQAAVSV